MSKICVSIAEKSLPEILAALRGIDFAEIRIDHLENAEPSDMKLLFSQPARLIATCRPGRYSETARIELLKSAISAGASMVDLELESNNAVLAEVKSAAKQTGCQIIISHHDFKRTPPLDELKEKLAECYRAGADIAKIACRVLNSRDNVRLLSLLQESRSAIVLGMGIKGRITRIAAPFLGSPLTYAAKAEGRETAEGQLDRETLQKIYNYLEKA